MKLIMCQQCGDIYSLRSYEKRCACGATSGKYVDGENAIVSGIGIVMIGIDNNTFKQAIRLRPFMGAGIEFVAFVMPEVCNSVGHVFDED